MAEAANTNTALGRTLIEERETWLNGRIERVRQSDLFTAEEPADDAAELDAVAPAEASSGRPGRPKGARNKISSRLDEYLAQLGARHPAAAAAEIIGKGNVIAHSLELSKHLGCEPIEALKLIAATIRDTMPYVARKMPLVLDHKNAGRVNVLHISTGGGAAELPAVADPLEALFGGVTLELDSEEYQALSLRRNDESEETESEG